MLRKRSPGLKRCNCRSQSCLGVKNCVVVAVRLAGPEEAPEPVFMPAGDDVDVEVRHALTHPVVDRDKRPLGFTRSFDCPSEQLSIPKEWRDQCGRQISQRLVMPSRSQKGVPRKEGAMVQKGERQGVFEDDVPLVRTALNFTKEAVRCFSTSHRSDVGYRISDVRVQIPDVRCRQVDQLSSEIRHLRSNHPAAAAAFFFFPFSLASALDSGFPFSARSFLPFFSDLSGARRSINSISATGAPSPARWPTRYRRV